MNERIQELARQAGAQHRLNLGVEEFCFEHHELKKFAELIVRECAAVAQDYVTVENNKLVEKVHISPWRLQDKIKEHFGVEE